ncbi:hypothetical protein ABID59_004238 [Bradyrhizobium sp. S3.3.6]
MTDTLETPELFDVDVNDLAWVLALMAALRLGRLQIAYPISIPSGGRTGLTVDGDTSTSAAIACRCGAGGAKPRQRYMW